MDILQLIISLVSGLVGGNIGGAVLKDKGLGTVGNSVSGAIGGGLSGYLLQVLGFLGTVAASSAGQAAATATGIDFTQLLGNVAGSGVGGLILTIIVSLIKNASETRKV
jgi:hypothetical protein